MYQHLNIDYQILNKDEIEMVHPLIQVRDLYGAASTPSDGHVDASGATHALARAARSMGAKIKRESPVEHINKRADGKWCVSTNDSDVITEHVVLANSFWAREMAQQVGLNLPLYALEHHEIVTDEIAALEALDFEVPTVRDPLAPSNTRQEGNGFLCGVYESEPVPWAVNGIPPEFAEQLLVPDLERLEPHLARVMDRIPAFGEAGIKVINNGPICYTPDGCPLLGPVTSHPGLWLACGFCVGIGTGGGSGEYLANWMVNGRAPYDLPIVAPSRFSNELSQRECIDLIRDTYAKGYRIPAA
jgi:dimethylglycine dehydrogenase